MNDPISKWPNGITKKTKHEDSGIYKTYSCLQYSVRNTHFHQVFT